MSAHTRLKKQRERSPKLRGETALVLRTCNVDLTSHNGFQWPDSGLVEAPDWSAEPNCGNGLHGLLWGEGNGSLLDWSESARWLVVRVETSQIVDLNGKIKFPRGIVAYCGDRLGAIEYLCANGGSGKRIVRGTATAGFGGTATAGDRGTATAGDLGTATAGFGGTATAGARGTATAGDRGTATAGDLGTATAGDRGTATAGFGGTATAGIGGTATAGARGTATAGYLGTATAGFGGAICLLRWNGKRYKAVVATVRDEDGDGQLKPNTKYRLDEAGNFEEVR